MFNQSSKILLHNKKEIRCKKLSSKTVFSFTPNFLFVLKNSKRSDLLHHFTAATCQRDLALAAPSVDLWPLIPTAQVLHHAAQPTAHKEHLTGVQIGGATSCPGIVCHAWEELRTKESEMRFGEMVVVWMTIGPTGEQLNVGRPTRNTRVISVWDLQMREEKAMGWEAAEAGTQETALKVSTPTGTWKMTSTWSKCTSWTRNSERLTNGTIQSPRGGKVATTLFGQDILSLKWGKSCRIGYRRTRGRARQAGTGAERRAEGTHLQKNTQEEVLPRVMWVNLENVFLHTCSTSIPSFCQRFSLSF